MLRLNVVNTAGAVFFACFSHCDALFKKAKNKALEVSALWGITTSVLHDPSPYGEGKGEAELRSVDRVR